MLPAQGHWHPYQITGLFNDTLTRPIHTKQSPFAWSHNWHNLIVHHIAELKPKPDYLVMNAGIWMHDLADLRVRQSIVDALDVTNITGIWKTTTTAIDNLDHNDMEPPPKVTDAFMCELMQDRCLNMSWTEELWGLEHYWDGWHFYPHVYQRANEQLLTLLGELEKEKENM
jgi:hypothetical protein